MNCVPVMDQLLNLKENQISNVKIIINLKNLFNFQSKCQLCETHLNLF